MLKVVVHRGSWRRGWVQSAIKLKEYTLAEKLREYAVGLPPPLQEKVAEDHPFVRLLNGIESRNIANADREWLLAALLAMYGVELDFQDGFDSLPGGRQGAAVF